MAQMYDLLMQIPLFQGLSDTDLTHILEVVRFDFSNFREGEVISPAGHVCDGIIFLISGRIRVETPIFNDRVMISQVFEAPYTFALHHMFGADVRSRSTLLADTDRTGIMVLSKADFMRILKEYEITLINTLNLLCTRAQKQHKALDFSGESDSVLKLASWMLVFTDRAAHEVYFDAAESDWCEMLQLDKPAFWRCVAMLEGQHLVEVESGRLKLLDRYGLRSLVGNKTAQK